MFLVPLPEPVPVPVPWLGYRIFISKVDRKLAVRSKLDLIYATLYSIIMVPVPDPVPVPVPIQSWSRSLVL